MNPLYGADQGPPHMMAHSQYASPQYGSYGMCPHYGAYNPLSCYQQPFFGGMNHHQMSQMYSMGYPSQDAYPYMPNGSHVAQPRQAGPCPNLDPDFPANQFTNSTGGTGCEPGYNYLFPAKHTKIHIFKTPTKPWQLPKGATIPFFATHAPVGTTCADMLTAFGCTNATPKMNRCYEVTQAGNGRWFKGLSFGGDSKDMLKKKIEELGWDEFRNGRNKPVVCLWFTKDGA